MPTRYPSLTMGAQRRLAAFRSEALRPCWARPMTWRAVRFANLRSDTGFSQGFNGASAVWYGSGLELPRQQQAHEVLRHMRHTGWYTEHDGTTYKDGSGLCVGVIARLSHGRSIAGYHCGGGEDTVWFPGVFTCPEEAARMADEHARVYAELCREDSEKFAYARELEDKVEAALQRLRECLALRHRACMAHVREEAQDLMRTIRSHRETLRTELAAYA